MAPTIRMKIDSTIAKTGRLMARWPMPMSVRLGLLGCCLRRRLGRYRLGHADPLEAVDDDAVADRHARAHDPQPVDDRSQHHLARCRDIAVAHHIDEAAR